MSSFSGHRSTVIHFECPRKQRIDPIRLSLAAGYSTTVTGCCGVRIWTEALMTTRVYLTAARLVDEAPHQDDLPAERVFVNAADVPEFWVDTESPSVPEVGKAVGFSLTRSLDIGFTRIVGTVERRVSR
ncbi:hypothetical protein BH20CHL3_BH20CHL3_00940 [soil metagenome]